MSACDCNTCRRAGESSGGGWSGAGREPPFFKSGEQSQNQNQNLSPRRAIKLWPGALLSFLLKWAKRKRRRCRCRSRCLCLCLGRSRSYRRCRRRLPAEEEEPAFSRAAHVVQRTHAQRRTQTEIHYTETALRKIPDSICQIRKSWTPIVVPLAPMAA